MVNLLATSIGRLRIIGFLEGVSLLLLVFVATPLKYYFGQPAMTKMVGSAHGALFLLFVLLALSASVEHNWKFKTTTWKVLLACIVPFGTFYIDRHILRKIAAKE